MYNKIKVNKGIRFVFKVTSEWRSPACAVSRRSLTPAPSGAHVFCGASLIIHYPQQTEAAKQNEAIAQCHSQSGRKRGE